MEEEMVDLDIQKDNIIIKYGLETYLTPKEIGEHLGFKRDKVYDLIKRPDFPKITFGKEYRIPLTAYQEWLKKQVKIGKFI